MTIFSILHTQEKKLNWLIFLLFSSPAVFSANNGSNISFPLPPRVSIEGTSGTNTFGMGDAMVPLWGNPSQSFYGDIAAKYGDDKAWFLSAGAGARKIYNQTILGMYFFGDYNKTQNANYFKVLNPGIEFMTNQWDGHLNAYVPVGKRNKLMGVFPGSQGGMPTNFFSGHTEYDKLFDLIENVGSGSDLEIGYTFSSLNRTRTFAGGYYFNPKYTSNVTGFEVGLEMPLKYQWASVEIRDSYDNVNHNTFVLTLRLTFGGLDKTAAPDIHDRMLDRIPRHLANLSTGDGIPSEKKFVDTGKITVVRDNIWFFNPDAPVFSVLRAESIFEECTFEHPCIGLNQTKIDEINAASPNANFYLSPGTYNNPDLGLGFNLRSGQNIFGRTSNFSQLATGTNRALLNDSLLLEGSNNVYNLRVNGQSVRMLSTGGAFFPFQVGMHVRSFAVGDVNIYNSEVIVNSSANNSFAIDNNSNVSALSIYNSAITSSNTNLAGSITIGAGNLRTGSLNISNSTISASNSDTVNNFNINFGVVNNESGLVNISNSSISLNSINGGLAAGILNNSTLGLGLGTINVDKTNIIVNANNVGLVGGVFNQANNIGGVSADININQSNISVTSNNNGGGTASGVLTSGTGTVSINNSQINGSGDSGSIFGIIVGSPAATVNFQDTTISLNTSGSAVGTPTQNAGTLNNNGGNECFENGIAVPC